MANTGLVDRINIAALRIDLGRKGLAVRGQEQEGRISYETGIAMAMTAFQEAQASADPYDLMLSEYTFISQEFQLCDKADTDTISSLTKAIESMDDAFLAIKAVDGSCYQAVDLAIPHSGKYRVNGVPKDAFHISCISHRTRLQNILRTPGLNPIEKALLKQRRDNLTTAQGGYIEKQKKALAK